MIIKFFKRWLRGSGIRYLFEDPDGSKKPVIMSGNPEIVQEAIDSTHGINPKTSGVLSFEKKIPKEILHELIEQTEKVLFPGLEAWRYSIIWVHHIEATADGKGRSGLHFVCANKDHKTGNILQPYFDKAHRSLFDSYQEIINYKYGFPSPKEPERIKGLHADISQDLEMTSTKKKIISKELQNNLIKMIQTAIDWGDVKSTDDVEELLKKEGYETKKSGKNAKKPYISIRRKGAKRFIRLRGDFANERYFQKISDEGHTAESIRRIRKDELDEAGGVKCGIGISTNDDSGQQSDDEYSKECFTNDRRPRRTEQEYRKQFRKQYRRKYNDYQKRYKTPKIDTYLIDPINSDIYRLFPNSIFNIQPRARPNEDAETDKVAELFITTESKPDDQNRNIRRNNLEETKKSKIIPRSESEMERDTHGLTIPNPINRIRDTEFRASNSIFHRSERGKNPLLESNKNSEGEQLTNEYRNEILGGFFETISSKSREQFEKTGREISSRDGEINRIQSSKSREQFEKTGREISSRDGEINRIQSSSREIFEKSDAFNRDAKSRIKYRKETTSAIGDTIRGIRESIKELFERRRRLIERTKQRIKRIKELKIAPRKKDFKAYLKKLENNTKKNDMSQDR